MDFNLKNVHHNIKYSVKEIALMRLYNQKYIGRFKWNELHLKVNIKLTIRLVNKEQ